MPLQQACGPQSQYLKDLMLVMYCTIKMSLKSPDFFVFDLTTFGLNSNLAVTLQISFANFYLLLSFLMIFFIIIFFKIISWKWNSEVSQAFINWHKINKSNTKLSVHYWIICLYSIYGWYYFYSVYEFLNFIEKCWTPKLSKYTSLT